MSVGDRCRSSSIRPGQRCQRTNNRRRRPHPEQSENCRLWAPRSQHLNRSEYIDRLELRCAANSAFFSMNLSVYSKDLRGLKACTELLVGSTSQSRIRCATQEDRKSTRLNSSHLGISY